LVNATALVNFGNGTGLEIGDWTYSTYLRSAPGYLPLNNGTTTYLASSYPALFALLPSLNKVVPVNVAGAVPTAAQYGYAVAYGGGTYMAVGNSGSCYSTDGTTWTAASATANGYDVAYGNSTFVSGGQGTISTSPTGVTWTSRTNVGIMHNCIVYAAGLFVAVGASSSGAATTAAATSPDGITWTARTIPSNVYGAAGKRCLAYGGGLFVALCGDSTNGNGLIYATSPDGITWTSRTSPIISYFTSLTYFNGKFIAIPASGSSTYYTSTDGINWVSNTQAFGSQITAWASGDGVLIGATTGTLYWITTDAVTWKSGTLSASNASTFPCGIAYGAAASGIFVTQNSSTGPSTTSKITAAISTTSFVLPVVTPVTGTFTYIRAT